MFNLFSSRARSKSRPRQERLLSRAERRQQILGDLARRPPTSTSSFHFKVGKRIGFGWTRNWSKAVNSSTCTDEHWGEIQEIIAEGGSTDPVTVKGGARISYNIRQLPRERGKPDVVVIDGIEEIPDSEAETLVGSDPRFPQSSVPLTQVPPQPSSYQPGNPNIASRGRSASADRERGDGRRGGISPPIERFPTPETEEERQARRRRQRHRSVSPPQRHRPRPHSRSRPSTSHGHRHRSQSIPPPGGGFRRGVQEMMHGLRIFNPFHSSPNPGRGRSQSRRRRESESSKRGQSRPATRGSESRSHRTERQSASTPQTPRATRPTTPGRSQPAAPPPPNPRATRSRSYYPPTSMPRCPEQSQTRRPAAPAPAPPPPQPRRGSFSRPAPSFPPPQDPHMYPSAEQEDLNLPSFMRPSRSSAARGQGARPQPPPSPQRPSRREQEQQARQSARQSEAQRQREEEYNRGQARAAPAAQPYDGYADGGPDNTFYPPPFSGPAPARGTAQVPPPAPESVAHQESETASMPSIPPQVMTPPLPSPTHGQPGAPGGMYDIDPESYYFTSSSSRPHRSPRTPRTPRAPRSPRRSSSASRRYPPFVPASSPWMEIPVHGEYYVEGYDEFGYPLPTPPPPPSHYGSGFYPRRRR